MAHLPLFTNNYIININQIFNTLRSRVSDEAAKKGIS